MKLFSLPAIRWMVMAVRTLDLDSQEDSRGFRCDFFGVSLMREDQRGCAVFLNAAGRRQQTGRDLVPASIGSQRGSNPAFELSLDGSRSRVCCTGIDDFTPVLCPITSISL